MGRHAAPKHWLLWSQDSRLAAAVPLPFWVMDWAMGFGFTYKTSHREIVGSTRHWNLLPLVFLRVV
jgi:hypothetical protein